MFSGKHLTEEEMSVFFDTFLVNLVKFITELKVNNPQNPKITKMKSLIVTFVLGNGPAIAIGRRTNQRVER